MDVLHVARSICNFVRETAYVLPLTFPCKSSINFPPQPHLNPSFIPFYIHVVFYLFKLFCELFNDTAELEKKKRKGMVLILILRIVFK